MRRGATSSSYGFRGTMCNLGCRAITFTWADTAIADLGWSRGVVQLGHHSYTPDQGCWMPDQPERRNRLCAEHWHWDNVSISPAVPFTLLRADRRTADAANGKLSFPAPAPANANLRFAGIGSNLSVSFDGGKTWQAAACKRSRRLSRSTSNRTGCPSRPARPVCRSVELIGGVASGWCVTFRSGRE